MTKRSSRRGAVLAKQQLLALRLPFPDGLDDFFRAEWDAENDHMTAFDRAVEFASQLGDTRIAFMWQCALTIGRRAGGSGMDPTRTVETSRDYNLGLAAGLQKGRTDGFREGKQAGRKVGKLQGWKAGDRHGYEQGKAEGLSEGKRLGFVGGRTFAERQVSKRVAEKSSTPIAPSTDKISTMAEGASLISVASVPQGQHATEGVGVEALSDSPEEAKQINTVDSNLEVYFVT